MSENYKKIDEAEILIGTMLALGIFVLCSIFDFFIVGLVVSPVIKSFFAFGIGLFFKSKGDPHADKVGAKIAQYAANLIPFIPSIVAAFLMKAYIHNHPKTLAAAGKVAGVAAPKENKFSTGQAKI